MFSISRSNLVLAVPIYLLLGCTGTNLPVKPITPATKLVYPYVASEARKTRIVSAGSQIKAGMSLEQARQIAGVADEIKVLYEPQIKNVKPIGHTHWYYIEIESEGELQDAALMRLSVDHSGTVTKIDHWGFDPSPKNGT